MKTHRRMSCEGGGLEGCSVTPRHSKDCCRLHQKLRRGRGAFCPAAEEQSPAGTRISDSEPPGLRNNECLFQEASQLVALCCSRPEKRIQAPLDSVTLLTNQVQVPTPLSVLPQCLS